MVEAILQFFDMGGHAAFIWPSFGIAGLVLLALWAVSTRYLSSREALLTALEDEESGPRAEKDGIEAKA